MIIKLQETINIANDGITVKTCKKNTVVEVNDDLGQDLIDNKLATLVGDDPDAGTVDVLPGVVTDKITSKKETEQSGESIRAFAKRKK